MKTSYDILQKFYKIINVSSVHSTIDGHVYRNAKPKDSQLKDIVLGTLPVNNVEEEDWNRCVIIVNHYAKKFEKGQLDTVSLKAMSEATKAVIEAYVETSGTFDLEITSEMTLVDNEQPNMAYSSYRINNIIEK